MHDLAIVLHSMPYKERDRIVTAVTAKHGLLSAFAKNSIHSRRFAGALDVFVCSRWSFHQRGQKKLIFLQEVTEKQAFLKIREKFSIYAMASFLNELLLKLLSASTTPEGVFEGGVFESEKIFSLQFNALLTLNESIHSEIKTSFLNAYLGKLLQWAGNQSQIFYCQICQAPLVKRANNNILLARVAEAGCICSQCYQAKDSEIKNFRAREHTFSNFFFVPLLAISDLQEMLRRPIRLFQKSQNASDTEHQKLFAWLMALLQYHLPGFDKKPLKSLSFLEIS